MAGFRRGPRPGDEAAGGPGRAVPGGFGDQGLHRGDRPPARHRAQAEPGPPGALLSAGADPRRVRDGHRTPVAEPHQRAAVGRLPGRHGGGVVRQPLPPLRRARAGRLGHGQGARVPGGDAAALPQHQLHGGRAADREGHRAHLRGRGVPARPGPAGSARHVVPRLRSPYPRPAQPRVPAHEAGGRHHGSAGRQRVGRDRRLGGGGHHLHHHRPGALPDRTVPGPGGARPAAGGDVHAAGPLGA